MIPLLSIVGTSGAGKTTLIEKLVSDLSERGMRVAVIKHHAHETRIDTPGKDTARYTDAGAAVVFVSSPVELASFQRQSHPLSLREIAARVKDVDVILAEGFSREPGPKIEIARSEEPISDPNDLVAIVSDQAIRSNLPHFPPGAVQEIADFVFAWFSANSTTADPQ